MAEAWRPRRTRDEAVGRAVQSMIPGSVRGRVASARPIPNNPGLLEQSEAEDIQDRDTYQIKFWQDEFILTADGAQSVELSFEPLLNSEHVYWNGLYQRENTAWTRAGYSISLLDAGYVPKAGDRVSVEYAYESGELAFEAVLFEAPDWRYLIVGENDLTNRSAVGYNDSNWNVGKAGFGWPLSVPSQHAEVGIPLASTGVGSTDVGIWMRRTVGIPSNVSQLSIRARVDGIWKLYFDGQLVGDGDVQGNGVFSTGSFIVDAPAGQTVIALHVRDDVSDPSGGDWIYADVEIVEA